MLFNWIKHWMQHLSSDAWTFSNRPALEVNKIYTILSRLEGKIDEALYGIELLRKRSSVYVGHDVALTQLLDDTPMYVNSNDFGGPATLLNGGIYEPENLDVIFSFLRDDSIFLDIGANLGFFSLMVARRVYSYGKVHAFEPNPEMARLLRGSAYINGFGDLVSNDAVPIMVHPYGAGDAIGECEFWIPADHAGGGVQVSQNVQQGGKKFAAQIKRLDEVFDDSFVCDLVKIDVEGHEVNVLRGMERIISRSKEIKIVFEKLARNAGNEAELESFFAEKGLALYAIESGSRLRRLALGGLAEHDGYALAAHEDPELQGSVRTCFRIYPRQLKIVPATLREISRERLHAAGATGNLLFHGPYWLLRAGVYELEVVGRVIGVISFSIAGRFGHAHSGALLSDQNMKLTVTIERDLLYFECVARAQTTFAEVFVEAIYATRVG